MKSVAIYADGGADPNPGVGGFGLVLIYGEHRKEVAKGFRYTTNNRMELLGVITGLEMLKERCQVAVFSDSKYIVDSVNNGALQRWSENDWKLSLTKSAKNKDLWKRLLSFLDKHEVTFHWVKGHSGQEENEKCDRLAMMARQSKELFEDEGYVSDELEKSDDSDLEGGDSCPKCRNPLERRTSKKKPKPNQKFRYEWYLFCPACKTMYLVEAAKKLINNQDELLL